MDTIMAFLGEVPIGMEEFAYFMRCLIFTMVLRELMDIIKGFTFRISKGGM